MRHLWPDIEVIRRRMLDVGVEEATANPEEPLVEAEALPMPAFVARQIQQLAESGHGERTPTVGDIVLIAKAAPSPVAVCLEAHIANGATGSRWRGWMVASETDYASDKDVLLEESDGPCDPMAGMVQTWNSLELVVPEPVRVLAHLSDFRMNLVREVARESNADTAESPRPGFVANRETASGRIVLTGTPLGQTSDPRAEFQAICLSVAVAVAQMAQPTTTPAVRVPVKTDERGGGFLAGLADWLMGHRLVVGATAAIAVVCSVVVSNMLDKNPANAPTQMASTEPAVKQNPISPSPAEPGTQQQDRQDVALGARQASPGSKAIQERAPNPSKPKQIDQQTQIASAPVELMEIHSLLVPLKDQSVVLAMRSGGEQSKDVKAYRVNLKPEADIDRAVEILMNLGFRIIRVEEGGGSLQVAIPEKQVTQEVLQKLQDTHLFGSTTSSRK